MLHVVSAQCVALDLHMIAPGPLECMCWRQFLVQWGVCKKSQIVPLNIIIIIITITNAQLPYSNAHIKANSTREKKILKIHGSLPSWKNWHWKPWKDTTSVYIRSHSNLNVWWHDIDSVPWLNQWFCELAWTSKARNWFIVNPKCCF